MNRFVVPLSAKAICVLAWAGLALSLGACASEPIVGSKPMMMLGAPQTPDTTRQVNEPADPLHELSRKSLAAKVLTGRALATVTGLAIDPARFSEHD
jgi:hypothetical protein